MKISTTFINICISFAIIIIPAPHILASVTGNRNDTIKIGLLVTDNNSRSAINGANLALDKINKRESASGHFYKTAVRSMEGTWGTGSTQTVNLIYKDKIWAVLGSHDGRNAHLVEQVIAKQHYVFLSAWATDPTLSQAFVPWYFSCVYNDLQQASSLVDEIYNIRKYNKVALVSDEGYDSKLGMSNFQKTVKSEGKPTPLEFYYNGENDLTGLADKINKAGVSCVILFGHPAESVSIIRQMKKKNIKLPVYGTLSIMGEGLSQEQVKNDYQGISVVTSAGWLTPAASEFRNSFREKYGSMPDATAAYAYDGINILVTAIKNSHFNIDIIKDAMMKVHYKGLTGSISFDSRGNRTGKAPIILLNKGVPVSVYH
jgi:branched-chain amino acid transport system substrate-binding protein